jgi:hypothetical protein
MAPPAKPLSLAEIHDVYRASSKKPEAEVQERNYRKTDRFSRDAGHSGATANRPPSPAGRKVR